MIRNLITPVSQREYIPQSELHAKVCQFKYGCEVMNIQCFYWKSDDKVYYPNRSNRFVVCEKQMDDSYKTIDVVAKYKLKAMLS